VIVPAGIEKHEVHAAFGLHLLQHLVEIDRLVVKVALLGELRIDGDQIIHPIELQPVSRVIEQRHLGVLQPVAEAAQCLVHDRLGDIDAQIDVESHPLERLPDGLSVALRIGQRRGVLIGAIADDRRDSTLGSRCPRCWRLTQCVLHRGQPAGQQTGRQQQYESNPGLVEDRRVCRVICLSHGLLRITRSSSQLHSFCDDSRLHSLTNLMYFPSSHFDSKYRRNSATAPSRSTRSHRNSFIGTKEVRLTTFGGLSPTAATNRWARAGLFNAARWPLCGLGCGRS
jgi:hypothetical protein